MIKKISSEKIHYTDMGWLKTRWLFSFSNYYDPDNISHGSLRVFNDDVVAPNTGFDTHPHEEMEIVSIVLDGEMTHQDTMGNREVIRTHDVQRMTAGTGLQHSEKNEGNKPVHFYQIWIQPDKENLTPSYDQKSFSPKNWDNKLCLLASDVVENQECVKLNSDAKIYRAYLDSGTQITHITNLGRKVFIYLINGEAEIDGQVFSPRDQARISEVDTVDIKPLKDTEMILIDVPVAR